MQPFMFSVAYQNKSTAYSPKIYTEDAVTNASGSVTFTIPPEFFTSIHSVHANVVRDTADPAKAAFSMIRTATKNQVVVQVFESKTTGVLLGGSVEGLEISTTPGLSVYLTVIGI